MFAIVVQMAALIACGVGWRALRPLGLEAEQMRLALTSLVYVLLLPALVLKVLWLAPIGIESLRIAELAAVAVLSGLAMAWVWFRLVPTPNTATGAVIIAAGFPNSIYLGLPVLQQSLGEWAGRVAIQYDLFACTPLLLSLGVIITSYYGNYVNKRPLAQSLLRVPALWAATAAVALNLGQIPLPEILHGLLDTLGHGVVPLMLISLGMSLRWDTWHPHMLPRILPVIIIRLLLTPAIIWWLAGKMGMGHSLRMAVTLETAMPAMVIGIVFTDRYGLDSGLYAAAVTVSTILSILTLPLWFNWLSS